MWALFKNDSKRLVNIFVLLTGFYFLGYLIAGFSNTNSIYLIKIIFYSICSVAIFVISLVNFKYLHRKTSATHILSLPLTKLQLCITKYLSGLCSILIPSMLFIMAIGLTKQMPINDFIVSALLFILLYYTLGCIIMNVTGKTVMHIFMYCIICFIPMLVYVSLSTTIAQYIYGMGSPDISMNIVYLLLPVSYLVQNTMSMSYLVVFIVYAICLIAILLWIAKVRPFEKTGEAVAFDRVDDIIRFLIVASFSWLLIALIEVTIPNTGNILLMACIFSASIITVLAELIFFKKIKILRTIIQITSICVVTVIIFFATSNYFQYRIPMSSSKVLVSFNSHGYMNDGNVVMKSENPKTMQMVQEIHEYLINSAALIKEDRVLADVELCYVNDNGEQLIRKYPVNQIVYNEIKTIFNNNKEEYVELVSSYYNENLKNIVKENIEMISIDNVNKDSSELENKTIDDKHDIESFVQKVEIQIERFKRQPELYQEINFVNLEEMERIYFSFVDQNKDIGYYGAYKNDPIYFALLDYKKQLNAK